MAEGALLLESTVSVHDGNLNLNKLVIKLKQSRPSTHAD
jgi:hypothetical protein